MAGRTEWCRLLGGGGTGRAGTRREWAFEHIDQTSRELVPGAPSSQSALHLQSSCQPAAIKHTDQAGCELVPQPQPPVDLQSTRNPPKLRLHSICSQPHTDPQIPLVAPSHDPSRAGTPYHAARYRRDTGEAPHHAAAYGSRFGGCDGRRESRGGIDASSTLRT